MDLSYTLSRNERIKSRELMDGVFDGGRMIFSHPFKLLYLPLESTDTIHASLLFGVTVPKRAFRKAVDRNRIKRYVREAYRHNKPQLLKAITPKAQGYALMYIYISKEMPALESLQQQMTRLHKKWLSSI